MVLTGQTRKVYKQKSPSSLPETPMARFTLNTSRIDPYKNFKFVVKFNGMDPIAGFAKCGGLKRTTEVIDWREGLNSSTVRKMPGRSSYQPVTMEAGLTHDTAFVEWADRVNKYTGVKDSPDGMSLAKYRKDIIVELLNEQGTRVLSYHLFGAWVTEYQALPDLDAGAHAVAITSLKIDHEGFDRDRAVKEPQEV
jgi:phage tail-like protein